MDKIDLSVPIPIYYQLKTIIQDQIERGILRPGDRLPTEEELCQRYNISRTPVRQALLELARDGLITRRTRRGTMVAPAALKSTTLRAIIPDARWKWPLQEAARILSEAQPHTPVHLDIITIPLAQLHDQLALAVANGQAPDIAVMDSVWVSEFADRNYLYQLAEIDAEWIQEAQPDIYPSLLETNSYRGKQYGLPANADATVLWYRRDWFKAEGLKPPVTWNELVSVGQHFQQSRTQKRYGLGRHPMAFVGGKAGGETTTYQLLPLLWSAGGDLVANGRVVLNRPATWAFLEFLRALVQDSELVSPKTVQLPWNGAARMFAHGEVAMILGGTYENFLIQAFAGWDMKTFLDRVGLARLPAKQSGHPATLVGGMTYGIYRQSRHPNEALALLKLALSPQVQKPFCLRTGQQPVRLSVARTIDPHEDGFLDQTASLFEDSMSRPRLSEYNKVSLQFQEMVEATITGQLSPEAAAHRAAERIAGITGFSID